MTTEKALNGKPYAGNPHVRFDEGEVAPCTAEASLRRVHCRRQPEGRKRVRGNAEAWVSTLHSDYACGGDLQRRGVSGATVHVSFGEELGGVKASAEAAGGSLYILKWEDNAAEKPGSDVSFVLDGDTGDYVLSVDATGLRFCKNRGLMIIIK